MRAPMEAVRPAAPMTPRGGTTMPAAIRPAFRGLNAPRANWAGPSRGLGRAALTAPRTPGMSRGETLAISQAFLRASMRPRRSPKVWNEPRLKPILSKPYTSSLVTASNQHVGEAGQDGLTGQA